MSWLTDSSTSEEEEEEQEQEEEQEEVDPEPPITDLELKQSEEDQEGEQEPSRQHSRDWETVMGKEQLAFDDLQSDSDTTADGCSPRCPTPHELGSPNEVAVEVHTRESEVEDL